MSMRNSSMAYLRNGTNTDDNSHEHSNNPAVEQASYLVGGGTDFNPVTLGRYTKSSLLHFYKKASVIFNCSCDILMLHRLGKHRILKTAGEPARSVSSGIVGLDRRCLAVHQKRVSTPMTPLR